MSEGESFGATTPKKRRMPRSRLEALYLRFFPLLVQRGIWRYQLLPDDAMDLAQDTFIVGLLKMRGKGNAGAWFIKVMDQKASTFQRKAARRADLLRRWGPPDEPLMR